MGGHHFKEKKSRRKRANCPRKMREYKI